jgi:hypothetical protein
MKIINSVYLSDLLSDTAYEHFSKKSASEIKESLTLFEKYMKYKDTYDDMLYSQPNWEVNYSVAEMDKARAMYIAAEEFHLHAWNIPDAQMRAILCVPKEMSADTAWILCYLVAIKDKHALLQVELDANGAWNYSLNTKELACDGSGEFDIHDYYLNRRNPVSV